MSSTLDALIVTASYGPNLASSAITHNLDEVLSCILTAISFIAKIAQLFYEEENFENGFLNVRFRVSKSYLTPSLFTFAPMI